MDEHAEASLRHPIFWSQAIVCLCFVIIASTPMLPSVGDAQVTTTITSSGLNTQVNQVGNSHNITGGTRPGDGPNLFHSFGNFSVGTGDLANFINNTGLPTSNILGRVTGGNISTIDGTIQTTGFDSANLFLMNPSGIVLGPGASLNVGGSVSFTTAQYLRLFDGINSAHFYANPANDGLANSILTIDPSAFEFLSATPDGHGFLTEPAPDATITVQGSLLRVQEGHSLSLVGGDLTVQSVTLGDETTQAANLQAPGGQIALVSVASPGEVLLPTFQTGPNVNGGSFTTMGTVMLKEGTLLDVSGQLDQFGTPIGSGNSGTVLVRGGQLVMDASAILANTVGAVNGAPRAVDIQVSQDVVLSNSTTILVGNGSGVSGRGGDVLIEAQNVSLSDFSSILTQTSGQNSGGDIGLNVGSLRLLSESSISSTTAGNDLDFDGVIDVFGGVGGTVTIQGLKGTGTVADSVTLSGSSTITSEASLGSAGGGGISIAARSVKLDEASSIKSSTNSTGIDLNGDGIVDLTGRGGDLVLNIHDLRVAGAATITSRTIEAVSADAADGGIITVQGLAGPGSKASSVLLSGQGTGIASDSNIGQAGEVTIAAGALTITDGAAISAGSSLSTGSAGKVTLTADSIMIAAEGQIVSRSFAQNSGQVTITADSLTLDDGSIDTSTSSEIGGRGGDMVINGGRVTLMNGASINSQSGSEGDQGRFSTGRAGDIIMNVTSLTLANQSEITSSSLGTEPNAGDAGNITVQSRSTVVLDNSLITTKAIEASGGRIEINAPDMIRLDNSQVNTSVKDGTGGGGNISIDPDFVILKGSQILAQAFAGNGGAIDVTAGLFLADPASVVDASSTLGVSGTVQINAPINNLSSVVARLPESLLAVQALLRASCAAKLAQGSTSSFVERGRDGIPAGPDGLLASPYLPPTAGYATQQQATTSSRFSGIQLRRLFRQEMPSSVTLISDHGGCVS